MPTEAPDVVTVHLLEPHEKQARFIHSKAKRKVIRAGRRGGKTTGIAILAVLAFLAGRRVLYAAPTSEQIDRFWVEVTRMLDEPIQAGVYYKNETLHVIAVPGTENRIRAKTAWDADSLRGDYADLLILDEFQLMNEDAFGRVGAPMLADNNGDAVFIYTPPSLHSKSRTKARDPQHAAKLFKRAQQDTTGRWETFHFSSFDNPHVSHVALNDLAQDMTSQAYQQEIMAEDSDEAPGALWTRALVEQQRIASVPAGVQLVKVRVGVDPPGGRVECGIVGGALGSDGNAYVLLDASLNDSPGEWGKAVVRANERIKSDRVLGEDNYGGDMVEHTIKSAAKELGVKVSYQKVHATRGKAVRAEPVAAQFEHGKVYLVGAFPHLENEMCQWEPYTGALSPNRLDAMVWVITDLLLGKSERLQSWGENPFYD